MKRVPVYLITGYLGSGKTTLLNNILREDNCKTALIVNDLGSVNIDASLLKNKDNLKKEDMKMVELSNGCICCTLQNEFMTQIEELSKNKNIERILVESSGISNPANIANGFLQYQEFIKTKCYLSDIITVVDSNYIYNKYYNDILEYDENSDPDIINLIMDQIEFCNVIIMNKCDLLDSDKQDMVYDLIRKLQSEAKIIKSVNSNVSMNEILSGKRLDFDKMMESSEIQKALTREEAQDEVNPDYGITSFVFENRRPLDRNKFEEYLDKDFPDTIIRAKGYIWFKEAPSNVGLLEYAGGEMTITKTGSWLGSFSKEEQEEVFKNYPEVLDDWDPVYQDRINQIVFIGRDLNKTEILKKLDMCLVD
ncbi:MAG: GTP-binding protein [Acholeplasmatales bacterium]|nr:GTP-binding protein [Acholeplasmatales bacterium]